MRRAGLEGRVGEEGADTHVVLCTLLVLVLFLTVHGGRDEVGHLDAVLQEVLWKCSESAVIS